MRGIGDGFRAHLEGEALTLCNCWRLFRRDGTVLGFTDHDRDIVISGIVHEALSGFEAGRVEESGALNADSHELAGALRSDRITETDILAGDYDGARIEQYAVNWMNATENVLMRTLVLGDISRAEGSFIAEARSPLALLDQTSHRRFEKACAATLGDAACGVDLVPLEVQGTVLHPIGPGVMAVTGLNGHERGWFTGGRLVFLTGANAGRAVMLARHLTGQEPDGAATLHLWERPAEDVVSGDTFVVTPGCDKQFRTCRTRFANGINFQGFPHMPGPDFAISHAANSGRFDGEPLIP